MTPAVGAVAPSDRPLSARALRLGAVVLWSVTAIASTVALVMWVAQGFPSPPTRFADAAGGPMTVVAALLYAMVFSSVGLLLALQRSRNPVGWIFLAIGLPMALTVLAHEYIGPALLTRDLAPTHQLVLWANSSLHSPLVGVLILTFFLYFPDGDHLDAGRRRLAALGIFAGGCAAFAAATTPGDLLWYSITNPFGLPVAFAPVVRAVGVVGAVAAVVSVTVALALVASTYRGGSTERKQQLKWIAYAVTVMAFCAVPYGVLTYAIGDTDLIGTTLAVVIVAATLLPIATAFAVTRYRLYEIDVLINRTIAYVLLTGILGGVFAALVAVLQRLAVAIIGTESDAVVILSTLIVGMLVAPGSRVLESLVDERFRPTRRTVAPTADRGIAPDSTAALEQRISELSERLVRLEQEASRRAHVGERVNRPADGPHRAKTPDR